MVVEKLASPRPGSSGSTCRQPRDSQEKPQPRLGENSGSCLDHNSGPNGDSQSDQFRQQRSECDDVDKATKPLSGWAFTLEPPDILLGCSSVTDRWCSRRSDNSPLAAHRDPHRRLMPAIRGVIPEPFFASPEVPADGLFDALVEWG